jgi:hypothetical protein
MCIVNPEMPEAYVLFHHFEKSVKPPQIESFAASKRRSRALFFFRVSSEYPLLAQKSRTSPSIIRFLPYRTSV